VVVIRFASFAVELKYPPAKTTAPVNARTARAKYVILFFMGGTIVSSRTMEKGKQLHGGGRPEADQFPGANTDRNNIFGRLIGNWSHQ
jgi:hypothetical protein